MRLILAFLLLAGSLQSGELHDANPNVKTEIVDLIIEETRETAKKFGIEKYTNIILAMWHVESNLNDKARNGDSYGIAQTRTKYDKIWRKACWRFGVPVTDKKDPKTQIRLGVAAYAVKLSAYKDPWLAVERYNGVGKRAKRHRAKVRKFWERMKK